MYIIKNNFKCKMCGVCCKPGIWKVEVDEKKKLELEQAFKENNEPEMINYVVKHKDGGYCFTWDENKNCKFLTTDNLCSMQKKYGEKIICDVCRTYPRSYTSHNNTIYATIELSCRHYVDELEEDVVITEQNGEIADGYIVVTHNKDFKSNLYFLILPYAIQILEYKDMHLSEKIKNLLFMFNEIIAIIKINKKRNEEIIFGSIQIFLTEYSLNFDNGVFNGIMNDVSPSYDNILLESMGFMSNTLMFSQLMNTTDVEKLEAFLNTGEELLGSSFYIKLQENKNELVEVEKLLKNSLIHILLSIKRISVSLENDIAKLVYFYNLVIILSLVKDGKITKEKVKDNIALCYKSIYHSLDADTAIEKAINGKLFTALYEMVL